MAEKMKKLEAGGWKPEAGKKEIAVLFCRKDSIYKTLPGCDVYNAERDALSFSGGMPVVAHPPCRTWGKMSHFSTAPPEERELAIWAVHQVRENGGVLEHPSASRLWPEMDLPRPGKFDGFGGWTLGVFQWWWGHKAEKKTKLYIFGVQPADIPTIPFRMGYPTHVVTTSKRKHSASLKEVPRREREATPIDFAVWLCELARRCKVSRPTPDRLAGRPFDKLRAGFAGLSPSGRGF